MRLSNSPDLDSTIEAVTQAVSDINHQLADRQAGLVALSHEVFEDSEIRFQEHRSSARVAAHLEKEGFEVNRGTGGMPTAFRAERAIGTGGPSLAIFCEYDALPEIGHACGHNVIATAGAGAAAAVASQLEAEGTPCRVIVLGSPAEEGGGGKVKLIQAGQLDGVDAAIMVHPAGFDAEYKANLGRVALEVAFTGRAAHAAATPDEGRNALDGAALFLTAIGLLRQQLRSSSRIHAIIVEGGGAVNVIPERARL
nr:amidohydrolase [Actinomycetota bacterium]